jgi:hypothetical protein
MRHWIGMALAVVMAGVLFFAGAWGYVRLLRFPAASGQLSQLPGGGGSLLSDHSQLYALAAIAGTGLLIGLLVATPRISPLAAGLPGLLLLGWTALYLASVHRAVSLIPLRSHSFGAGFEAMLFNGILAAVGIAMIIPLFVPSRWRARRTSLDDAEEAEDADEFVTMLGGSRLGDTAVAPVSSGLADRTTQAGRIPTAANLPAAFRDAPDPEARWSLPGRSHPGGTHQDPL